MILAALAQPAAAADIMVKEGETAIFAITLPYGGMTPVRYAYRTENGSARAGEDYKAKQGHVVIPALMRTAQIRVRTYKDEDANSEHFSLVLSDMQTRKRGRWGTRSRSWATVFLPASMKLRATILDDSGRSYDDEKYGPGHTGTVWAD